MRGLLTFLVIFFGLTCNLKSSLNYSINYLSACLLYQVLAVVLSDLFKEKHGDLS
jgi:hypothetical protein